MKTLRVDGVAEKLGISPKTVWRFAKTIPAFPKPFKLSANITVWDEADLDAYIEYRKQGDQHGKASGAED